MEAFFEPRGVAIIGASKTPGKIGHEILRSMVQSGFDRPIYPINPGADRILGLRSYPSLEEVPGPVDLAVLVLPAERTPEALRTCCRKGVKAVVIVSGGFAELDGRGKEIQSEVVDIAKNCDMRVIGPNCIGIYNPSNGLDTFFQPREAMLRPPEGPVGFMTQSGTYGCSVLEALAEEELGVSRFVSYGNKADVDEVDFLRYLLNDDGTRVIGAYVEGIGDGDSFVKVLREVVIEKPVVVVKAGRTEVGRRAARSHTGALAGDYRVFSGVMRQNGVILVPDLDALVDVLKLLALQPLPKGGNIAMVTNGVGPCVVAVDRVQESSLLQMARLSDETQRRLREAMRPYMVVGNPVDLTGSARGSDFTSVLDVLYSADEVDIVMSFLVIQDAPLYMTIDDLHRYFSGRRVNKTTVMIASGGPSTRHHVKRFQRESVPVLSTAVRAVEALERAVWYGSWRRRRISKSPSLSP